VNAREQMSVYQRANATQFTATASAGWYAQAVRASICGRSALRLFGAVAQVTEYFPEPIWKNI